jgi:uncharacterized membrane protein YebE (DUF533 family)
MAKEWALGAGAIFALTTLVRTMSVDKWWRPYIPGGIAVAVGMFSHRALWINQFTKFK